MMDPAVKTGLAACVILVGFYAATLFRGEKPVAPPTDSTAEDEALLNFRGDNPGAVDRLRSARTPQSAGALNRAPASTRPAMVVTPLDRREPPPSLAADYPAPDRPPSSRWGVSMEMMLPAADLAAHSHTIVDGDTLPTLARRYLGSADRAKEIFALNRDVLHDPELLPIGVEVKLPPRGN